MILLASILKLNCLIQSLFISIAQKGLLRLL
jgi:hypothetical protein